ncbi:hypothetical protein P7K49_024230 [Saguinus oedipus]|uniref:Uncharacterized protein n=1 Tax=Saguinus oedipus TaxID=9490 RepID=A0ABQ9UNX7_SAGOE|nr:hypothetical protein P7K49_024230 [Saguinus oedipus]
MALESRTLVSYVEKLHLGPTADYWLSLLYKRLIGPKVLAVHVAGLQRKPRPGRVIRDKLRIYAHCTNHHKCMLESYATRKLALDQCVSSWGSPELKEWPEIQVPIVNEGRLAWAEARGCQHPFCSTGSSIQYLTESDCFVALAWSYLIITQGNIVFLVSALALRINKIRTLAEWQYLPSIFLFREQSSFDKEAFCYEPFCRDNGNYVSGNQATAKQLEKDSFPCSSAVISGLPPTHHFPTSHLLFCSLQGLILPQLCKGETHKCKHVALSSSTAGLCLMVASKRVYCSLAKLIPIHIHNYVRGSITLFIINLHRSRKKIKLAGTLRDKLVHQYLLQPYGQEGLKSKYVPNLIIAQEEVQQELRERGAEGTKRPIDDMDLYEQNNSRLQ